MASMGGLPKFRLKPLNGPIAPMAVAQPIVAAHPKRTFHPQGHLDRDR
jgi:hypothetical protein